MKNKHLIWVIPLLLVIGYLSGLYINLPQTLTIEFEYNETFIEKSLNRMENIMDNTTIICPELPECICEPNCMFYTDNMFCVPNDDDYCEVKSAYN